MKWCIIIPSVDKLFVVLSLIADQVNTFRELVIYYQCDLCRVTIKDYHTELDVKFHANKEISVVIPENRTSSLVQQTHMEG
jgi:hypothetical protein